MSRYNFIKGMGVGVATGVAIGMAVTPSKKGRKSVAGRAIRAFGELIENISNSLS